MSLILANDFAPSMPHYYCDDMPEKMLFKRGKMNVPNSIPSYISIKQGQGVLIIENNTIVDFCFAEGVYFYNPKETSSHIFGHRNKETIYEEVLYRPLPTTFSERTVFYINFLAIKNEEFKNDLPIPFIEGGNLNPLKVIGRYSVLLTDPFKLFIKIAKSDEEEYFLTSNFLDKLSGEIFYGINNVLTNYMTFDTPVKDILKDKKDFSNNIYPSIGAYEKSLGIKTINIVVDEIIPEIMPPEEKKIDYGIYQPLQSFIPKEEKAIPQAPEIIEQGNTPSQPFSAPPFAPPFAQPNAATTPAPIDTQAKDELDNFSVENLTFNNLTTEAMDNNFVDPTTAISQLPQQKPVQNIKKQPKQPKKPKNKQKSAPVPVPAPAPVPPITQDLNNAYRTDTFQPLKPIENVQMMGNINSGDIHIPFLDDDTWVCPACQNDAEGDFCDFCGQPRLNRAFANALNIKPTNSQPKPQPKKETEDNLLDSFVFSFDKKEEPVVKKTSNNDWNCTNCGTPNNSKFCHECGTPKPEIKSVCENCGWQPENVDNPPKFCPECGTKY